jgi:hypothetical protein
MRLGYKITLGVIGGFALGYGTFKIIGLIRQNKANERFTMDVQKKAYAQTLLIMKKLPVTDANLRLYEDKTLDELIYEIENFSNEPQVSMEELVASAEQEYENTFAGYDDDFGGDFA